MTAIPFLYSSGYEYAERFPDDVLCLTYRYHDVTFTDDKLQTQAPGRVSLHIANEIGAPERPHPKVSKKLATAERIARLAPTLAESFWSVDAELRRLGVEPTYGGKNFVRYRTKAGTIAEAVVVPSGIRWRITLTRLVERDSQIADLRAMLRDALGKTGES